MAFQPWCTMAVVVAAGMAGNAVAQTYTQAQARVLSSVPVSEQVAVPQQICQDAQVSTSTRTHGTGAVVGAILGGVAGNAMGRGGHYGRHGYYYPSTRGPNTVVGAIAGGLIGNAIESANSQPSYETVRRCTQTTGYEWRVVGYDVTYEYAGQRYSARMDYQPGAWMPVNVQPQSHAAAGNHGYASANSYAPPPSTTQFVGPSGVYQPAPATVVVTNDYGYAPPAPPMAVFPAAPVGYYPPPPPAAHWR